MKMQFLQTILLMLLAVFSAEQLRAQCTNAPSGQFPTSTFQLNQGTSPNTLTSCAYTGEFSEVTGVQMGRTYTVTSSIETNYITVTLVGGTVVGHGVQPFVFVAPSTANLLIYRHDNAACGTTNSGCRTIIMTCSDCMPPPPPANDNCSGAIAFPAIPSNGDCMNATVTTVGATGTLDPVCAGAEDDDVWHTFTTPAGVTSLLYTNTNISGNSDRMHQLYSGSSCGALTSIGCFDPESGTFTGLTGNTTYYLRTYTFGSGVTTTFNLCLRVPPPPPTCPGALGAGTVNIASLPYNGTGLTNCGNGNNITSSNATVCGSTFYYGGEDKTFIFTPTVSGAYDIILTTASTWSGLMLYAGCPFSGQGGTCVAQLQNSSGSKTMPVTLMAGITYYLVVDSNPSPNCHASFDLSIAAGAPPPANDNCTGAISLPVNSGTTCAMATNGTTAGATQSIPASPCTGTANDDVWYSFVATATAHDVTVVGATGFDAVLNVRSGACDGTSLVCRDATASGGTEVANLTGLTIGATYLVRVYHWSNIVASNPTFTICVTTPAPPPANDDCAGAISLPVNPGPTCAMATNGTTASATQSLVACTGTANDDVWYSFVATNTSHDVTVVGAANFDAVLNVRTGACNGTSLVCRDATGAGGTEVANLTGLTVGATYLVRVHHFFSAVSSTPTFTICVTTPVPPCNAPSTPTVNSVGVTSASISWGAVSGATLYRYSGGTGFHTCGTGSQTTAGTSVNLTGLTPNTTYTFCVRTDACGGGAASAYVSTTFTTNPLPNDNCNGAINVTCGQTVNGSTVGATSNASMGSCSLGSFGVPGSGVAVGGTPGIGVWYRLMGDGSQVSASLCNSSYDTKIHIYEGACGTLTCVASNDDNSDQCTPGSRSYVQFNTNPGTAYYILVSGFSSSTGTFSLQLGCVCGAPLGAPWTTTAVGGASGESIDNVCGGSIDVSSNGFSTATSDKMVFSSQQLCGDGSITVRVANVTNQGYAGITMRENMAPGSRNASLSTQLAGRVFREVRAVTNGVAQKQQLVRLGHNWLRIVRSGNMFSYFSSANGTQWGFVGASTIALPNCIEVGMYATGINQVAIATAVFTDVEITGNVTILGCTDPDADNYDPSATVDDGSCQYTDVPCLSASFGQWPGATFTPNCPGGPQNITTCGFGSEFSRVNVIAGNTYSFASSVGTDYISISDAAGSIGYAAGVTPLVWTATFSGEVRFYTHLDDTCPTIGGGCRTKSVACMEATPPMGTIQTASPAQVGHLTVFPNPSSGELNLRLGQEWMGQSMEVSIFSSVGKMVMFETIDQVNFDVHSLSVDHVASGIYFLQVRGENGMSKTERIVINK